MPDDFSPRAYVDARIEDARYYNERLREEDRAYVNMRFEERGKATEVALDAATEKGIQHNGVLDTLRAWQQRTITWPVLLSALIGAGAVVGIYETFTA